MKRTLMGLAAATVLLAGLVGVDAQTAEGRFLRLVLNAACTIRTGSGSPESAVTGVVCDQYYRTDGGAGSTFYTKESGSSTTGWVAAATSASTSTFTGKTLDVEASGNVLTTLDRVWLPGARCQNVTASSDWSTPTSNAAGIICNTGSNTQKGYLEFPDDGATVKSAQTAYWLPADFTGAIDVRIRWFTAATSGNVIWSLQTICVADAETSDPAFNTASTVTDAAKGTTLQDNDAAITSLTATGCAAGEMLYLRLSRDPSGSDTLSATANVRGIELTIRRAQ